MIRPHHRLLLIILISLVISATLPALGQNDTLPPTVLATTPANGSENVDPGLSTISVRFNEAMADRSWSWVVADPAHFPEITGDPSYNTDFTVNTLPVKLQANREYRIWLNSNQYQGFRDSAGNPLYPFLWIFSTGPVQP